VFGLLGRIYPKADWAPRVLRAKTTFEGMARTSVEAYFHSVSILRGPMREPAVQPALKRELAATTRMRGLRPPCATAGTDDPLALIQYLDSRPTWWATSTPRSTAPAWRIRWKCASR
jgi:asparagine synthase (glutamine-hydrolysing)